MKLLVGDATYPDREEQQDEFRREIESDAEAFHKEAEISTVNVGPGADFPSFLIYLPGLLATTFLLGERIEKNLDAWIRLIRRVGEFIRRMKDKTGFVALDEDGAKVLAVETILSVEDDLRAVVLRSELTIPIGAFADGNRLDGRTNALYLNTFLVNSDSLWVVGVRSTSGVDFVVRYGAHYFTFSQNPDRWFDIGLDPSGADFS